MRTILSILFSASIFFAIGQHSNDEFNQPFAPDYSDLKYWIAHPETVDFADLVPGRGKLHDEQYSAHTDVFFIYPTAYTGEKYEFHPWFADVNDVKLNKKIAETSIQYKATVFNGSARVFSPLYRQAHNDVFYADSTVMEKVLDMAYQDIKRAFEYYLDTWNGHNPIIIASHSQGTTHATRLLHEFFENKLLMRKLVAAYLVGMPVPTDEFEAIPLCEKEDDYGCWMTWNTFKKGYYPESHPEVFAKSACINPLIWTLDDTHAHRRDNKGGVLDHYEKIKKHLIDARVHEGMLWVHKPRYFGNFMLTWDQYHEADYSLFYMNVRENVEKRVNTHFQHLLEIGEAE